MAKTKRNSEKYTSEAFSALWAKLSRNQRRFVVAMQDSATKKEAAESIGIEPGTVYQWPDIVDEAVDLLTADIESAVWDILMDSAAKAAMVKVAGLDEHDDRLRQAVATELLDRIMGKPTQRTELSGPDGGKLVFEVVYGDDG